MPCPYFKPDTVASNPQYTHARLPLLDEYEGQCCATEDRIAVPEALRFRCCNHGYSQGACDRFPNTESRSCLRYTVLSRTLAGLDVLCVEEQAHFPVRWQAVRYSPQNDEFDPAPDDVCMRAQLRAFCRSYLRRFSD